jgi:hypothetical protein
MGRIRRPAEIEMKKLKVGDKVGFSAKNKWGKLTGDVYYVYGVDGVRIRVQKGELRAIDFERAKDPTWIAPGLCVRRSDLDLLA